MNENEFNELARPYLKLWSSVMSQAIKDACDKPQVPLRIGATEREMTALARKAMEWLFESEHCRYICDLLDINPDALEYRLTQELTSDAPERRFGYDITGEQRRSFRFNYRQYQASRSQATPARPPLRGVRSVDPVQEDGRRAVPEGLLRPA